MEGLKALWQKLDQGSTWDYSVDTLRQVYILSSSDMKPDTTMKSSKLSLFIIYIGELSYGVDDKRHLITMFVFLTTHLRLCCLYLMKSHLRTPSKEKRVWPNSTLCICSFLNLLD